MSFPEQSRRRWTLRARLTALVLAVAAVALAAVDILLPMNLRTSLVESRDATLVSVVNSVKLSVPNITPIDLQQAASISPLRGGIGWSYVSETGKTVVLRDAGDDPKANPLVKPGLGVDAPITVGGVGSSQQAFRVYGFPAELSRTDRGYLMAWMSIDDINATVKRLIFTELLITAALLLLLGATASMIIRRELRPLESMAAAADDIAEGDLDRRVYPGDQGTEVGRLGVAFNGMLDGISELLDERTRNEVRLRQFIADASHELRTPVAAVRGYTDLYGAGALPDTAAVDRAMERMGFESRRMGALVEDLLTLIQADAEKPTTHEPVHLGDLLRGVVEDAAVIDSQRSWRLVGVPEAAASRDAVVLGDRLRLHQLFANLLANIRTHTPAGTTATVSVLTGTDDVAISVCDNGPGVSDEALPKLFDRFYRVDASRSRENGGTGLGLSIVAAIVRSHRGRILASHTAGGGLTVTVILPRVTGTAAIPPHPGERGTS